MMMQHKPMVAEPIILRDFALHKQEKARRELEIKISHLAMATKSATARIAADELDMKPAWFCLRVATGFEMDVENYLIEEGVEALVVRSNPQEVRRRRRIRIIPGRAILRGYVMVRCLALPAAIMGLLSVDNVLEILGGPVNPYRASEKEINDFKMMALDGKYDHADDELAGLTLGDVVRVTDGPFAWFQAVVTAIDEESHCCTVEIDIFGKAAPCILDLAAIQKL